MPVGAASGGIQGLCPRTVGEGWLLVVLREPHSAKDGTWASCEVWPSPTALPLPPHLILGCEKDQPHPEVLRVYSWLWAHPGSVGGV